MPIVSKRRHVDQETGQTVEDWDLVFADDEREANPTSFKFLQMAHAWKATAGGGGVEGGARGALAGFVSSSAAQRQNMDVDEDEDESDAASSRAADEEEEE